MCSFGEEPSRTVRVPDSRELARVLCRLLEHPEEARELALGRERVRRYVDGGQVMRIIYVPQRLVNIVVK